MVSVLLWYGTLQYSDQGYHRFYNRAKNLNTLIIDGTGNAGINTAPWVNLNLGD